MGTIDGKLYEEFLATAAINDTCVGRNSPLKAATTSPLPYTSIDGTTAAGPSDSPPRPSNVTVSSIVRLSAKGRSLVKETPVADWLKTPQIDRANRIPQTPTSRDDNLMAELSKLLAETDPKTTAERHTREEQGLQLNLFRLSLEGPSTSRPSIEFPPTLSRLPLAKRHIEDGSKPLPSSQESIFVAGTQFPAFLPDHHDPKEYGSTGNEGADRNIDCRLVSAGITLTGAVASQHEEVSSMMDIPPTQYPAVTECSQVIDLFGQNSDDVSESSGVMKTLSPSTHLNDAVVIDDSSDARSPVSRVTIFSATLQRDKRKISELGDENPFLARAPKGTPVSAIKKTTIVGGATQKRVQFAPSLDSHSEGTPHVSDEYLDQRPSLTSTTLANSPRNHSRRRPSTPARMKTEIFGGKSSAPSEPMEVDGSHSILAVLSIDAAVSQNTSRPPSIPYPTKPTEIQTPPRTIPLDDLDSEGIASCQPLFKDNDAHQVLRRHLSPMSPVEAPRSSACNLPSSSSSTGPPLVAHEVESRSYLCKDMLVWAKWRYQYYAPAILQSRPSRTRDLWKIRFAHWRGGNMGEASSSSAPSRRTACLAADQVVPLTNEINVGQIVWIVRNRKRMQLTEGQFSRWHGPGKMGIEIKNMDEECREEIVDLQRVLIDRSTFIHLKTQTILSSTATSPGTPGMAGPSSSLAPSLIDETTLGKRGHPKHSSRRSKPLAGYVFWLSLGGGLGDTAKRTQKSHLISKIRALGGTISAKQNGESTFPRDKDYTRTILLTNGCYRLAKVYLALILGIKIVRLEWLEACEQSRSFIPSTTFVIPIPHDKPIASSIRRRLLANWYLVIEGSGKFKASWTPVCKAAGAIICTTYSTGPRTEKGQMRILVERLPSSTSRLARFAKETGIIVVTVDWLMQSILTGRVF